MDRNPLVSIVTIVYNGKDHLEQTIQSVLSQSYQNIEYIIIDGGSSDGSVEIIKKYADKLAYWVSEKDKGISDAFNKGIGKATGELIGLINADDWYELDAVEHVVGKAAQADILYGEMAVWQKDSIDLVMPGNDKLLKKEMTINHPTVFVKKQVYEKYGTFDHSFRCAMDYELLLRFYAKGCSFAKIDRIIANLRWEGFSDQNWKLGCRETLLVKNRYFPNNKLQNFMYYLKHYMAIGLPKLLKRTPLNTVIQFYQSRFSRLKRSGAHHKKEVEKSKGE